VEEGRGDGEGWRALAGVEDTEAAAGACSGVEEAATFVESLCDGVDCFRNLGEDQGYGRGDLGVLLVDEAEHVESRELVDVFGAGVVGFGGKGCQVCSGFHRLKSTLPLPILKVRKVFDLWTLALYPV
jgi:hypothetical protein